MPAQRLLPDAAELKKLRDRGLTHQEIAEHVYKTRGVRVTRGAVSAALARAGLSTEGHRYDDELPWRVKAEHAKHYAARMLRLLGRRRAGLEMSLGDEARLDAWLLRLERDRAVVHYDPSTAEGFFYVPARPGRDGMEGIPIRRDQPSLPVHPAGEAAKDSTR